MGNGRHAGNCAHWMGKWANVGTEYELGHCVGPFLCFISLAIPLADQWRDMMPLNGL